MKTAKGQAAMEYLATYGWALLILAIVIAAILATGVFNPNYVVIEECYLGPSFKCHAQVAVQASQTQVYMNLTNRIGYPVKVKSISFSSEGLGTAVEDLGAQFNASDSRVFDIAFSTAAPKNSVKKILMNITYYICAEEVNPSCAESSSLLRTVSGRIVARVS